jgi:hypothetical protein
MLLRIRIPVLAIGTACSWSGILCAQEASPSVPGTTIAHAGSASSKYTGSPGLAKLPDGTLVASHDEFGGGSSQNTSGITRIYRSTDRGLTWTPAAVINGAFWSTLFVHRGALYLLGTTHQYGDVVIRRSGDGGLTWTSPGSASNGLLANGGHYHCAPMPVIEHGGRLWRAMERRDPASGWAPNFRSGMMSAPAGADLLDAAQWTFSNLLPGQSAWLGGKFGGWLEGNAVVDPAGNLVNLLRVDHPDHPEKAALLSVSADGLTTSFNPATGFVEMPGGAKKFAIRHDLPSNRYWSLANRVPGDFQAGRHPASTRNTLSLVSSADLRAWTDHGTVLSHPDPTRHGFQYVEWQFDGDDLIATSRTAFIDTAGGAANYHDANHLTFHRIRGFRDFAAGDLPGPWRHAFSTDGDLAPDDDADHDGFTNRHEFLAGSHPQRPRSTPAGMARKARVALAGSAGVDLYQVTAAGGWTYERQLTSRAYQSLILHQGFLYGAGFDRVDRIDPESGATTTLATRNAGAALAAGWTTADTQQLAVGPDGLLYFSTAFGTSSGQGVFRLGVNGSSFSRFIDRSAPTAWDLNNARGLAWLDGRLYVSSRGATNSTGRPVYEFNAAGQFIRILRGDLRAPQGLLADGDSLRVAGYGGYLNRLSPGDGGLAGLVSGLPSMIAMNAVELFGEVHVVTYQHGIWRHRESSTLTRAFMPLTSQHASMVVVPQADPYDAWIGGYDGLSGIGKQDDPDGDGVPNGLEFLLGWNPADGLSRFSASLVQSGENTFRLRWPSGPGTVFTVRSSSDLRDWSRIEAFVTGSAGETTALLDIPVATGNHRFYRIEWLAPAP